MPPNSDRTPIELVIFNCEGVLIDSEIVGNQQVQQELTEPGHYLALEQYMEIGISRRKKTEPIVFDTKHIDIPIEFWEKVNSKLLDTFPLKFQPISGVKEILDRIGIKKCIASNSSRKKIELSLAMTNLLSYFQGLIFDRTMVTKGKTHHDLFLMAAQALQVPPSRCLVIENTLPGIRGAIDAGMRVWGFVGGKHCFPAYVDRIQEAGVELVFDNMSQLLTLIQAAHEQKGVSTEKSFLNKL